MDDLSAQMRNVNLGTGAAATTHRDPDGTQEQWHKIIGGRTPWVEEDVSSSMLARPCALSKSQEEWEDIFGSWDMMQVCALYGRSTDFQLAKAPDAALEAIKKTAAHSAIRRLVALQHPCITIRKLLTRYHEALIGIAQEVLNTWNARHELVLSKIAESCYVAIEEGIELGNIYLSETEAQSWAAFWRSVLQECPYGPTLFDIRAPGEQTRPPSNNIPRYLFRVFDKNSKGRNDEDQVASPASVAQAEMTTLGLLSDNIDEERTKTFMLFKHLKPREFSEEQPDNLVSWTSSFLFAIQCAIYRCWKNPGTEPADVKICIVDTTKFPRDQFMRDLQLIRVYNTNDTTCEVSRDFFDFRLRRKDYWNGECLSQGLVALAGRSGTTSLHYLISSGLCQLYPEFADPRGKKLWTNRVLALRREWSDETFLGANSAEKNSALRISESYFPEEMSKEVGWMLLCFKNRHQRKFHSSVRSLFE